MVCRRMLCRTGVFSRDAGTRWQIAAYHMERRRQWVPRGRPCHGKTAQTVMSCFCRWNNKVTTCSGTEVATSRIRRDWMAVIREVLWRQVVRTLEHNQTQFKLDTLVDWQPVKEITHRRRNAVAFAPAEYQSIAAALRTPCSCRGWMLCTPARTSLQ